MTRRMASALLFCAAFFAVGVAASRPALAAPAPAGDDVLQVDKARGDALAHQDFATVESSMADDLVYCHASGKVDSKASYMASLRAGTLHYTSVESNWQAPRIIGDVAVLTGPVTISVLNGTAPRTLSLQSTAVYAKRGGKWLLIAYQSTPLPAPGAAPAPASAPAK